jgi:hypothetical protein
VIEAKIRDLIAEIDDQIEDLKTKREQLRAMLKEDARDKPSKRIRSPETRERISEEQKRRWAQRVEEKLGQHEDKLRAKFGRQ